MAAACSPGRDLSWGRTRAEQGARQLGAPYSGVVQEAVETPQAAAPADPRAWPDAQGPHGYGGAFRRTVAAARRMAATVGRVRFLAIQARAAVPGGRSGTAT